MHGVLARMAEAETHLSLSGGSSFFLQLASIDCIVLSTHESGRDEVSCRGMRVFREAQRTAADFGRSGPATSLRIRIDEPRAVVSIARYGLDGSAKTHRCREPKRRCVCLAPSQTTDSQPSEAIAES